MMSKPDTPHHEAMLSVLFNQQPRPSRSFIYDTSTESPEVASLTGIVVERLTSIFRLHGAVDMEPPLLMPIFHQDDQKNQATLVDRHGDLVTIPSNIWRPFARLAARAEHVRIKRYHVRDSYDPRSISSLMLVTSLPICDLSTAPGHPVGHKEAIFDIITPDLVSGPAAPSAELLA